MSFKRLTTVLSWIEKLQKTSKKNCQNIIARDEALNIVDEIFTTHFYNLNDV